MYLQVALHNRAKILENEDGFRQLKDAGDFLMDLMMEDWKTNYARNRMLGMTKRLVCEEPACTVHPNEVRCKECRGYNIHVELVPSQDSDLVSDCLDAITIWMVR